MEIEVLGLPPAKVKQLNDRGIETIEDLLKYFPREYLDFSKESEVSVSNVGKNVAIVGTIEKITVLGRAANVLKCSVLTKNGKKLDVLWFNQMYLKDRLSSWTKKKVLVCGKLNRDTTKYFNFTIVSPYIFTQAIQENMKIIPVYKKVPGMADDYLKNIIKESLSKVEPNEYLTDKEKEKFRLCDTADLYQKIHNPKDQADINASKRRLIFDDMYYFANKLYEEAQGNETGIKVEKTDMIKDIIRNLPFKLTDDQMNTVADIVKTCQRGERINALVQGDVGSGKTIVAFLSMILFAENGYQSVLLAPTQVLALQHYADMKDIISKFGIEVVLLKSKMKAKEKREALAKIKSGEAKIVIGTHSVFSKNVEYDKLGMVVVDEEHKFGVAQRSAVLEKTNEGVHCITLSATPIPRSLAMTLYGVNKRVYTIAQMPSGRKPVKTLLDDDEERIFEFIYEKIKDGQQCYIVCPLKTKSDNEKFDDIEDVEDVAARVNGFFGRFGLQSQVITGSTGDERTAEILEDFQNNKIQILVATTIIEVGVNVPNANVILIKNAERFGLAQLHQLRGRVGRGNKQGYCILQSEKVNNERLHVMCQTNNGFEIAAADLKNRGCGDLIGTKQSGDNKYIELMLSYPKFYNKVKTFVEEQFQEG